jgi:pimeloyl-ACP methyl ester carboxylesterase
LLHGFPTSSTQYQELIDRCRIASTSSRPTTPGFGYTEPLEGTTTFERLADVVDGFVHALDLDHYGLYVFDFGAPVGFRLATRHPERVDALIVQNGNAYEAGIGPNLAGLAPYWEDREAAEPAARTFLQLTRRALSTSRASPTRRASTRTSGRSTSTSSTSRDAIR